ncbi:MAG: bifunctional metallophosphatase/5'-nucleotidase [Candidatus Aminicenantales bacterium]
MENKIKKIFSLLISGLLLAGGILLGAEAKTITFIHTNDVHGIYKPYEIKISGKKRMVGGMETLSHYLNELRGVEENVILIDCGDVMTGTLVSSIEYEGVVGGAMIEFMNRLKYDIWCFGNHEFDKGPYKALGLANLARFPVVMANIVYKKNGKLFASNPYYILEKAGVKVGIIAVMEENFRQEVHRERIKELDVMPIVPVLKSYIPLLEKETDLIVVLVHAPFNEGLRVAEEVPGVDIVFTASEDGRFRKVNEVLVQSTFGHQRTLGYLKVRIKEGRITGYEEKLVWLWADVPLKPSPEVSDLAMDVETLIGREYTKVIGMAKVAMRTSYFPGGDTQVECNLGDWITDVMRWKTGVEVALHNTGGIRSNIPPGPITIAQIFEVCPFRNTLVVFKLRGSQLKEILERDVERGRDRMQVSGLEYRYYTPEKRPFGQRIDFLKVNGEVVVKKGKLLLPERVFSVVTNDYVVVQAEEKYFGFRVEGALETKMPLDQALIEWLEVNRELNYKRGKRIIKIE